MFMSKIFFIEFSAMPLFPYILRLKQGNNFIGQSTLYKKNLKNGKKKKLKLIS